MDIRMILFAILATNSPILLSVFVYIANNVLIGFISIYSFVIKKSQLTNTKITKNPSVNFTSSWFFHRLVYDRSHMTIAKKRVVKKEKKQKMYTFTHYKHRQTHLRKKNK